MEEEKQLFLKDNYIVFNKNEILEAIKENKLLKVIFKYGYKNSELENTLKKYGIPISIKDKDFFKKFSKNVNFIGYVSPIQINSINEIEISNDSFYVLPLNIEDPHNLGAIIRSAEIFGAKGIILPKRRGSLITPTVIKSSTGAIFHLKIFEVSGIVNSIKELKKRGFWIISLDMKGNIELHKFSSPKPFILITGGEDKGINQKVLEESDYIIKIKTYGKTESLNSSVALGIALYELTKS
ncbi:MAG: 23S rRNA (guanosine(2251)-2'-O)-methyltransferase RlmB [Caldisericia bacterium]|nr:23S rRNA (guanosine(2251)-2'-O)-methyltransferase RlmB [Caldisericia bacterium]